MSTPTSTISSLGVNVAGFLRGGLGLGQAARLYVASLNAAGIPVTTTTLDPRMPEVPGAIAKSAEFTDQRAADEPSFNLVCVNAPELPSFYEEVGREFFEARYTIGVWAWETDVVPASWSTRSGSTRATSSSCSATRRRCRSCACRSRSSRPTRRAPS
jgi:hypothetical protein